MSNRRIKEAVEKFGERFLRRVYTQREIEYCFSQRDPYPCLAARWACKEAVMKAVYAELKTMLTWKDIEVNGVRFHPPDVKILRQDLRERLKLYKLVVSISHERDYSVAVAQLMRVGATCD